MCPTRTREPKIFPRKTWTKASSLKFQARIVFKLAMVICSNLLVLEKPYILLAYKTPSTIGSDMKLNFVN